ncbi:MAG: glycosyltransferase, partial [Gammaproteobacteria bacterium]|nr:glycosyltransferase [Gammaproteobacteria bacterium]
MTHLAPLISVLMPVHNAGIYLAEAVTSILNQKDVLFELILIDDHSTDNAIENLPAELTRDERLSFFSSDGHGVVAAMETGFS